MPEHLPQLRTKLIERSVVIIGAGYAGVMAANRLQASLSPEELLQVKVTVVNATSAFIERIRLHQVAAGILESASIPLSDVLHPGVQVVIGTAVRIDAEASTVHVATHSRMRSLRYDQLVYAVGSHGDASVTGVKEHAHLVAEPGGAASARAAIAGGPPGRKIVVVGGGLTAIETASEIAESNTAHDVTIVSGGLVGGSLRPLGRRSVLRSLNRLGVRIREGVAAKRVLADRIELEDGTLIDADVCVWAASFAVPELAATSDLPTDDQGRLRVDENLRCVNHPEITGAGDAVTMLPGMGHHLKMGCASAMALGGYAATNVLAGLRGVAPEFVSPGYIVQCISLGRRNGYIQFVRSDGSPRQFAVAGRLGATMKEAVCSMTVNGLRKEREEPGSYWSPRGPERQPKDRIPRIAPGVRNVP
jgi:NADH dehydrogenase